MKKFWPLLVLPVLGVAIFVIFVLTSKSNPPTSQISQETKSGACREESIEVEGYGDKAKKLSNCFVEFPGEPTRQDKSYYIVEDICGQFTKEFVQNALGRTIQWVEKPKVSSLYNCKYYLNDKNDYVMLVMEYLKIDNQQKGQETLGRKTESLSQIPMRNLVVWQENGDLNSVYLVLGDDKFISLEQSSGASLSASELTSFATNLATGINNYK